MTAVATEKLLRCKWCSAPLGTLDVTGAAGSVIFRWKCARCALCNEVVTP